MASKTSRAHDMAATHSRQAYAMEVVALKNAQTHSDKAQNLLKQARKENSMVQDCGSVIITPGYALLASPTPCPCC